VTVHRERVTAAPGAHVAVDLSARAPSAASASIVQALGQDPAAPTVDLSEMLRGPIANRDLSLWLALAGASRILARPESFEKLSRLPLATFDHVQAGEAPVYVLLGTAEPYAEIRAAVGTGRTVRWEPVRAVPQLVDVYEYVVPAQPGPRLLSIRLGGRAPVTMPLFGLPNRVSLVTMVTDERHRATLHQYLLPLYHLKGNLPPQVVGRISWNPLTAVRSMWAAQYQFARRRDPAMLRDDEASDWRLLIEQKWLDPIMSTIAAYQMLREGRVEGYRMLLRTMLGNLRRYFAGLPDTEAVARLLGEPWTMPNGAPLVLDGYLAFEDDEAARLSPGAGQLDYGSPWTLWQNAVAEAATEATERVGETTA
jgi:hypothetical protein